MNEYVDFTNEIMKKYSFSQDGSQLQFYIKRIKVTFLCTITKYDTYFSIQFENYKSQFLNNFSDFEF